MKLGNLACSMDRFVFIGEAPSPIYRRDIHKGSGFILCHFGNVQEQPVEGTKYNDPRLDDPNTEVQVIETFAR